jgi:hypothetical protein
MFSADELKEFLFFSPRYKPLLKRLPGESAPLSKFVLEFVRALERRGWLDKEFFDDLEAVRPGRCGEINMVRSQF